MSTCATNAGVTLPSAFSAVRGTRPGRSGPKDTGANAARSSHRSHRMGPPWRLGKKAERSGYVRTRLVSFDNVFNPGPYSLSCLGSYLGAAEERSRRSFDHCRRHVLRGADNLLARCRCLNVSHAVRNQHGVRGEMTLSRLMLLRSSAETLDVCQNS